MYPQISRFSHTDPGHRRQKNGPITSLRKVNLWQRWSGRFETVHTLLVHQQWTTPKIVQIGQICHEAYLCFAIELFFIYFMFYIWRTYTLTIRHTHYSTNNVCTWWRPVLWSAFFLVLWNVLEYFCNIFHIFHSNVCNQIWLEKDNQRCCSKYRK